MRGFGERKGRHGCNYSFKKKRKKLTSSTTVIGLNLETLF